MKQVTRDDRIFPSTRIISAIVVPFLILAFLILYLFPDQSGERFAWAIKPHMTAMFIGAGYLGGAYLFIHVIFGRHWQRVAIGFLPVTSFTISMLLATILHWERFDLTHLPFQLWLILYVATPFIVPWMWLHNRTSRPEISGTEALVVPKIIRWGMGIYGVLLLGFTVTAFVAPDLIMRISPWTLTPLTARIFGGWFSLLGVGGIVLSREPDWQNWKIAAESIALWQALVLAAALLNRQDFSNGSLINWYTGSVVVTLVFIVSLYAAMELRRRRLPRPFKSPAA